MTRTALISQTLRLRKPFLVLLSTLWLLTISALAQAEPRNADQVIDQNLRAMGGQTKWLALESVYERGHWKGTWMVWSRFLAEFPADYSFELIAKRPGKLLVTTQARQGLRTNVCDGNGAAAVRGTGFGVFQAKAEGSVARWCGGPLVLDALLWRGLKWKVSLRGRSKVRGSDAWIVRVSPPYGDTELHYFDVTTGLRLRSEVESPLCGPPLGAPVINAGLKCTVEYSDYREVNGLKFPFRISSYVNLLPEKEGTVILDDVEVNTSFEDALFRLPDDAKKK